MATNSVLARLAVNISANTAAFNKGIADTRKDLNSFKSSVTGIGAAIGIAFGAREIASFAVEVSKLAGQASAVRVAFERLPNSTRLMEQLKEATGGTVSELELMKRAVQANNFEISLSALPRLLEFATLRAQQTGQSVDYLVDSIVTGIGRKSKLILDNLGISAVQLNEALGGVTTGVASIGDVADAVGKIAEKNLQSMAGFSENAATKMQRLGAAWENFKVSLGNSSNETGVLGTIIKATTDLLDIFSGKTKVKFSFLEALGIYQSEVVKVDKVMTKLEKQTKFFDNFTKGYNDLTAAAKAFNDEQYKKILLLQKDRDTEREIQDFTGESHKERIDELTKEIKARFDLINAYNEYIRKQQEAAGKNGEQVDTLASLKLKLEELNTLFEETDTNDKKKLQNLGSEIIATQKLIEELEKLRKAKKGGEVGFFPDLEAEGSTNPDLRNMQAANETKELSKALKEMGTSAEFAGGAMIKLDETSGKVTKSMMTQWLDLTPVIQNGLSGIAHALGDAMSGARSFGEGLLAALGGVLVQLGEMLIAAGVGVEAFKQSLQSLNGAVAIAAGIALVALGSYLSGSIRNLGKGNAGQGMGVGSRGSFGNSSSGFSVANGSMQDTAPQLITVIKGADLWVMLENYQRGNIYTRAVG